MTVTGICTYRYLYLSKAQYNNKDHQAKTCFNYSGEANDMPTRQKPDHEHTKEKVSDFGKYLLDDQGLPVPTSTLVRYILIPKVAVDHGKEAQFPLLEDSGWIGRSMYTVYVAGTETQDVQYSGSYTGGRYPYSSDTLIGKAVEYTPAVRVAVPRSTE